MAKVVCIGDFDSEIGIVHAPYHVTYKYSVSRNQIFGIPYRTLLRCCEFSQAPRLQMGRCAEQLRTYCNISLIHWIVACLATCTLIRDGLS